MRVLRQRGDDETKLCAALNVTKGYLTMIGTGARPESSLSVEFVRSCANYLEVPSLIIQIIAGRISEQDLVELGTFAGTDMGKVLGTARELPMKMND